MKQPKPAYVFHFHSDRRASGCDGPVEYESVITEFDGEKGRLAWTKYVSFEISCFGINAEFGPQTMRRWRDEDGTDRFLVGGPADEGGYRWEELRTCESTRCTQPTYRVHYRDVFAEAAGY